MKRAMVGVVCALIVSCVVLTSAAFGADGPRKESVQRTAFKAGGTIYLHLGAGDADVVVKPGTSEIVVTTKTKEAETKDTRVSVKVVNTRADVSVHGPKNHFEYRVEIPSAAHLIVRMSAGDLNISGVDGDLDAELHAGDCNINLGATPDSYGPVDLSVRAGDVEAPAFKVSKDGLFRHHREKRIAKFKLHAHVGAGDLRVK
jgi:hypothetical protein